MTGRMLSLLRLIGVVAVVAGLWPPSFASASGVPTHRCGAFLRHYPASHGLAAYSYRISVFNKNVSCVLATQAVSEFWTKGEAIHHGGPSDAQSYWTLRGMPGWRCTQGAGAGSCVNGIADASYEVKNFSSARSGHTRHGHLCRTYAGTRTLASPDISCAFASNVVYFYEGSLYHRDCARHRRCNLGRVYSRTTRKTYEVLCQPASDSARVTCWIAGERDTTLMRLTVRRIAPTGMERPSPRTGRPALSSQHG